MIQQEVGQAGITSRHLTLQKNYAAYFKVRNFGFKTECQLNVFLL